MDVYDWIRVYAVLEGRGCSISVEEDGWIVISRPGPFEVAIVHGPSVYPQGIPKFELNQALQALFGSYVDDVITQLEL